MKKLIILFFATFVLISLPSCDVDTQESSLTESVISVNETSLAESVVSAESTFTPEEVYSFLLSGYSVSSRRESFGMVYESVYYLENGVVSGVKLITTFETVDAAEDYYEHIKEDCPDAQIDNTAVTQYTSDKDGYYGYTLDKLIFMLEKTGYEYTLSFDTEEFYSEFSTEIRE